MAVPFVSEQIIEAAAEALNAQELDDVLEEFGKAQPTILAFLLSDSFEVLFPEERDYMLYLALVMWRSITEVGGEIPMVTEDEVGLREEVNWGFFESHKTKPFRQKMDAFFEDTSQEDLMAFVEDALEIDNDANSDEDGIEISNEGRGPMAIGLKTIIDVLTI